MSVLLLAVEDNADDQELLTHTFDGVAVGPHLVFVGTIKGALDYLGQQQPDCVLLDLGLPDSEGVSGLKAIRQAAPRVPVVVLTGAEQEMVRADVLATGALGCLSKRKLANGTLTGAELLQIVGDAIAINEGQMAEKEKTEVRRRYDEIRDDVAVLCGRA